jgi:hypothetical protein
VTFPTRRCLMSRAQAVFGLLPAFPLAAVLVTMPGCASINPLPPLGFDQVSREERDIAERIRLFSARVEVYREFRTVFTARTLFLAPEVRRAAAAWESRSRMLDPAETAAVVQRIVAADSDRIEFLVGFYASDEARSRLEDPAGGWEIYLGLADGRRLRANCLLVETQEGAPYLRFLRWDLSWSRLYRVCFPVSPDDPVPARGMTLVIAGPDGKGEMVLIPPAPPNPAPAGPSTGSLRHSSGSPPGSGAGPSTR